VENQALSTDAGTCEGEDGKSEQVQYTSTQHGQSPSVTNPHRSTLPSAARSIYSGIDKFRQQIPPLASLFLSGMQEVCERTVKTQNSGVVSESPRRQPGRLSTRCSSEPVRNGPDLKIF
jgi:hypothetical protein